MSDYITSESHEVKQLSDSPSFEPFYEKNVFGIDAWELGGALATQSSSRPSAEGEVIPLLSRQGAMGVEMGVDDGVVITCVYSSATLPDLFGQVGPALGLARPGEAHPLELGWGPVWDIAVKGGVGGWYFLNVFESPTYEILRSEFAIPDVWRYNGDPAESHRPGPLNMENLIQQGQGLQKIEMVANDGVVCVFWNDTQLVCEYPRPEWTMGRDWWGVRAIDVRPQPGSPHVLDPTKSWGEPGATLVAWKVELV